MVYLDSGKLCSIFLKRCIYYYGCGILTRYVVKEQNRRDAWFATLYAETKSRWTNAPAPLCRSRTHVEELSLASSHTVLVGE